MGRVPRKRMMPYTTLSGRANLSTPPNIDAASIACNRARAMTDGAIPV